jgi:hypothetical protein
MLRVEPTEELRPKDKEKPILKQKEWCTSLKEEDSPDIDIHIYNFFVAEGHYDLAKSFAQDAKLNSNSPPTQSLLSMKNPSNNGRSSRT